MKNIRSVRQAGFTIPELLVTFIVAAIFITLFLEMFTSLSYSNASTEHQSLADNTTYSLLKQYASIGNSPSDWFTCDTSTQSSNDLMVNIDAPGSVLQSGSLTRDATGLPEPITYTVTALAIYGCAGANTGKPVRVQATLAYGAANTTVTYAILAGY